MAANPLCLNYMHCQNCKHFTPEYAEAVSVYGSGFGLCDARKIAEQIPATVGYFSLSVHELFGCVHFEPNLDTKHLTKKWRVKP